MRTALALACAALLVAAAVAVAHTKVFSSALFVSGTTTDTGTEFSARATGYITAWNGKCYSNRTVRLYFDYGQSKVLIDVDTSSRNGAWAVKGKANGDPVPDSFTIRLARQRIDSNLGVAHEHICSGDTETRTVSH